MMRLYNDWTNTDCKVSYEIIKLNECVWCNAIMCGSKFTKYVLAYSYLK